MDRRDQLQAYRFQHRRALAALVTGEPNAAEAPMRRLGVSTLSGILIALAVVAGVAVFGVLEPAANDDWKAAGAVIVTNDTAAVFVRIDGVLHPVVNFASAVLAVSGSGKRPAKVVHVDGQVLAGVDRGPTIGVADLPTSLPSVDGLVSAPFTVCSRNRAAASATLARVSVGIGGGLDATPLAAGTGVVVRSAGDGAAYLILVGRHLAIGSSQVATALQLDTAQAVTVGTAFLDAVPAGPALSAPVVPHAGTPYRTPIAGRRVAVGRLLHDTDDDRYLLLLADGVAGLTDVQARLLQTLHLAPHDAIAAPVEVSRSDVIALAQSSTAWAGVARQFAGLPAGVPRTSALPSARGGLCARYDGRSAAPVLAVPPGSLPSNASVHPHVSQSALSAGGTADTVSVAGGGAAVVRSGQRSTFLVADPGRRYRVGSDDVLAAFGYAGVRPASVLARALAVIPAGTALDPVAARKPVAG